MRLAYSISGYKLPGQLAWLMTAIRHADDLFVLHVDARTPQGVYDELREAAGEGPNVVFIERQPITWMGISLVEAELRAIRAALGADPPFDYLISLSMQDYPLKSRAEIVAALEAAPGLDHVTRERLDDLPFHIRRRPWLVAFERRGRLVKTPIPRPIPKGLELHWKGSWWRVLSRRTCEWLVEAELTRRYLDFLRHVQAPDELFFQNLLMQGPHRDRLAERNRHFVAWSGIGGSPRTLTMAEAEELLASPLWFARKFDETVDRKVLELLAQRIGADLPPHVGRQPCPARHAAGTSIDMPVAPARDDAMHRPLAEAAR
ncbi:MAG: beta-1,6-N-acetylglucosaminyltransferase [Geminicoccaceae bacterium]